MDKDPKTIAAVAAVMRYIRDQEDAIAASAAAAAPEPAVRPMAPVNIWGISGRQGIMDLRSMMQMKAFHAGRLR